jgi:hypothetical protein
VRESRKPYQQERFYNQEIKRNLDKPIQRAKKLMSQLTDLDVLERNPQPGDDDIVKIVESTKHKLSPKKTAPEKVLAQKYIRINKKKSEMRESINKSIQRPESFMRQSRDLRKKMQRD